MAKNSRQEFAPSRMAGESHKYINFIISKILSQLSTLKTVLNSLIKNKIKPLQTILVYKTSYKISQ